MVLVSIQRQKENDDDAVQQNFTGSQANNF